MLITIHLRYGETEALGRPIIARSDYPAIEAQSIDQDHAVNFVKGACLMAVGHWPRVPSKIEFLVTWYPESKKDQQFRKEQETA